MSRFKILIDFKAVDLDPNATDLKDGGNEAHFINKSVSAEARQAMQKTLMELFAQWGQAYLDKNKS